jgi:hypothetical protein
VIVIEKETDMKVVMKKDILHPIETVMADMAVILLLRNEEVQVPPLHLVNLASPEEEVDPPAINNPWIPLPQQVHPPFIKVVLIV